MQSTSGHDVADGRAIENRILIVEDDLIIAFDLEDMLSELGFEVAGLASSLDHAVKLAPVSNIAFVDVNLSDGASGPEVGRILAEQLGIAVVFITGNTEIVADGIPGTLGMVSKPVSLATVEQTVRYIIATRANQIATAPPALTLFGH
jgi:DNA-binding NtrC family response regulator